jgi:hypothetical protein
MYLSYAIFAGKFSQEIKIASLKLSKDHAKIKDFTYNV